MAINNRKTFNDINITPLTDIFLVLLIIMMVIAPLLDQQGLNLSVPNTQEIEKVKETKIITVNIDDQGVYKINGDVVTQENLLYVLKDKAQVYTEGLLIEASSNSTHGNIVKVMDTARNVGISAISISEI